MKTLYRSILGLAVAALFTSTFTGCIEETEPTSVATEKQIAESAQASKALLMAMPAYFNSLWDEDLHYSFGYGAMIHIREIMTADYGNNMQSYNHWYRWQQGTYLGDNWIYGQFIWNYYWGFVQTANNMVGGVDPENATEEQLGYLGAGLAYRAMLYLDLARMYEFLPNKKLEPINKYGNDVSGLTVPIVKAGMHEDSARVNPRVTREVMSKFIEDDLTAAEGYIVNLEDTRGHVLPDLACVYGLKARLYMWLEDYPNAQKYARLAIDNAAVDPMTEDECLNTTTGFNVTDPWMWGAQQTTEDDVVQTGIINWTSWSSSETTFGYYGYGTGLFPIIDRHTYERISDTDFRKLEFKAPEDGAVSGKERFVNDKQRTFDDESEWYMPPYAILKFRPGSGNADDYMTGAASAYPIMRVEEMYFIEAEAAAHQNASKGLELVSNFMKTYRDPNYTTKATSTDDVVEEIVFQKRVELIGEGLNFFDIKRLNYSVTRGYTGTNHYELSRLNTEGRPAWMNFVMVQTEGNNNSAVKEWNNPDPSDLYTPWNE
ncbi:MAG: RagB/SusD family nutrient uptake outer membrane protein [Bacteroidaceae bacterium]|nr:RagB/SusD family nutrient uptake outer membrane protein [Bacteroidaceae bacterium]